MELGNAVKEKGHELKGRAEKEGRAFVEDQKKSANEYMQKNLAPGFVTDKLAGIFAPRYMNRLVAAVY